jgi:hypothetical protein
MKIIQIDGGIGRVLCATHALENLYKRTGEKFVIATSWHEVLFNAPYISKLYNLNQTPYFFDDIVKHGEFITAEPYQNFHYYNQRHHLVQSFNFLLNGDDSMGKPTIYLSPEEEKFGQDVIQQVQSAAGKKIVVALQAFGSGAKLMPDGTIVDPSNRSLTKGTVDAILNNPDCVFINLSHIPMNHPNVWQQELNIRQIFAITKHCNFLVSIDSLLSHVGVAFDKPGVLMLGGTFKENVGYDCFRTVQREGFPKSYFPNRFHGFVDNNQGAMDFTEEENQQIVAHINELCNA